MDEYDVDMDPCDKKRARYDLASTERREREEREREYERREREQRNREYYERHAEYMLKDFNPDIYGTIEGYDTFQETLWRGKKAMDEAIRTFEEIKGRPYYRNQRWHMVQKERLQPESELELRWDHRLNTMYLMGDRTNLLPVTVQIYSLKLISNDVADGEDYSLDVFGELLLLCSHSVAGGFYPQTIFKRTRENCQTLTKKDPYLLLTGPNSHPVGPIKGDTCISASLILKGTTKSEDKYLTLSDPCILNKDELVEPGKCCKGNPCSKDANKHYWLEMTRSIVTYTIVATISVRLTPDSQRLDGSPPGSYFFTAYACYKDESSPCDDGMKVVLLDSRGDKVEVDVDKRTFVLSRQTICVNMKTESLMVHIEHGQIVKDLPFTPRYEDEDLGTADIGWCKIQVEVKWSTYWNKYRGTFCR